MYEIKRSYLVPYPVRRLRHRRSVYPFWDMDPGDSFFVPEHQSRNVRQAASNYSVRWRVSFKCERHKDYEGRGPGIVVTRTS